MLKRTLKSIIRKLAIKLGLKNLLLLAYQFWQNCKTTRLMGMYSSSNTTYGLNTVKRDFELTVSFTTYPARIDAAIFVADTMLRQTLKPDRVILVLASDEFGSKANLPKDYAQLEKRGLTIVFAENLKPHKKYFYAISNYPDSILVTVDDDVLYPETLLETLFTSYSRYPNAVSARRAHRMMFSNRKLLPYKKWIFESEHTYEPSFDLIATGVGGILYPPNCLSQHKDILLNSEIVRNVALNADDIWLKFIELKCGIPVVIAGDAPRHPPAIPGTQKSALMNSNVDKGNNDITIKSCMRALGIRQSDLYAQLCGK